MKMKKLFLVAVLAISVMLVFASCSASTSTATSAAASSAAPASSAAASSAAPASSAAASSAAPALSAAASAAASFAPGTIVAAGSTALQPLAQKAADLYMTAHTDVKLGVQGGGSGTGLTQVAAGAVDIGNSDLFAAEKLPADQANALVDHQVCVSGFATVVNADVTIKSLTGDQLIAIFTGKTTNWKDVGGKDEKIVILNRPTSSGTRATFKKYALNGADEAQGVALTEDASGTVAKTVDSTPGAISYLALSYINSSSNTYKNVKALQFNGVDATPANIESGKYPIWSIEHMYTKGEATGNAKAFLDYMVSKDFAQYITQLGYIPSSAMNADVLKGRTK